MQAVRFLERETRRQVIQLDVKILWATLQLTFEVEQEPPERLRFRLTHELVGEYRGVCVFEESAAPPGEAPQAWTGVELATWLKPARPVPMGLVLLVERMTLLRGVRSFLEACERQADARPSRLGAPTPAPAPAPERVIPK